MTAEKAPEQAPESRAFTQFLHEQRRGGLHQELSDALADVVRAVKETGKAGSLSVTLKVRQAGDAFEIHDTVKASVPEPDKAGSLFFADDHGNVSRRDPRQMEIQTGPQAVPAQEDEGVAANG